MKNKIVLAVLSLFAASQSSGQTVGDDFESTETRKPYGTYHKLDVGFTYEHYNKEQDLMYLYFFGNDSICENISIRPQSERGRNDLIEALDYYLPKSGENQWYEEREDGSVMGVTMTFVEGNGELFLFGMIK